VNDLSAAPFGFTAKERLEYEQSLLRLMFASLIEAYLESSDIEDKDLASRMGRSKSWVSKLLSGTHNPTLDTLTEVAHALGLRWDVKLQAVDRGNHYSASDPEPPKWVDKRPLDRSKCIMNIGVPSIAVGGVAPSGSVVVRSGGARENFFRSLEDPMVNGLFALGKVEACPAAPSGNASVEFLMWGS
jgi:transcriptional regulator with XRE-family HTH domain